MRELNNEEMLEIKGGAFRFKAAFGIIGCGIAFLIGVIDGLVNPRKCN